MSEFKEPKYIEANEDTSEETGSLRFRILPFGNHLMILLDL